MHVLVTGATGFVGSHVARQLLAAGQHVCVLVRPNSPLKAIEHLPVEPRQGDLRDADSLRRALRGVQQVYHLAADYRLWARDPREIYESNVAGTRNFLLAAKRAGIEKFIYTSTVATVVVPHRGNGLPSESTPAKLTDMIGHYKRSKFLAEQEALRAAAEGLPLVVVNPTAPVGPGDWKPTPTGQMILDFLNGRMPAYVNTGLNVVSVEDVAAGHLLAAQRGKAGERYILGGKNMSLKEILRTLAAVSGRSAPWIRLPHSVALAAGYADHLLSRCIGREPRIPLEGVRMARHHMFVDGTRAMRELGYQPSAAETALERAVRWYENNGYVACRHGPGLAHAPAA